MPKDENCNWTSRFRLVSDHITFANGLGLKPFKKQAL